jgi:hypothetical protein
MVGLVCAPAMAKKTLVTRASSWPLCSSASSVLANQPAAVIHDSGNLCALAANALIKGRTVMTHVNQIETRRLIRQQTDAKKGLFSDIFIS